MTGTPADATFIAVTVKVFGGLRDTLGAPQRTLCVSASSTLESLLAQLRKDTPDFGTRLDEGLARGYVNILVNGRNARFLEQLETGLNDGDVVAFLPPVGGG